MRMNNSSRLIIAKSLFILQVPGTKGAEIEEGVRERLKPWLNKGKLAIVRKVSAPKLELPLLLLTAGC